MPRPALWAIFILLSLPTLSLAKSAPDCARELQVAVAAKNVASVLFKSLYHQAGRGLSRLRSSLHFQVRDHQHSQLENRRIVLGTENLRMIFVQVGAKAQEEVKGAVYNVDNWRDLAGELKWPPMPLHIFIPHNEGYAARKNPFLDTAEEHETLNLLVGAAPRLHRTGAAWKTLPINFVSRRYSSDYGIVTLKPKFGGHSLADLLAPSRVDLLTTEKLNSLEKVLEFARDVKLSLGHQFDLQPSNLRWIEDRAEMEALGLIRPSFILHQVTASSVPKNYHVEAILSYLHREKSLTLALRKLKELPYLDANYFLEASIRNSLLNLEETAKARFVPIGDLFSIHPIDDARPAALNKFNERKALVEKHRAELLQDGRIAQLRVDQFLPSKNAIRAVRLDENVYVIFDGNGRFKALHEGLGAGPENQLEIEEWGPIGEDLREEILYFMHRKGMLAKLPASKQEGYLNLLGLAN